MDNELFELCKEVYERTGWETKARYYMTLNGKTSIWHWQDAQEFDKSERTPIYNSDYLLEKLPKGVTLTHFKELGYIKRAHEWSARMTPAFGRYTTADTPLKALLKLTIALHEAGELK